VLGKAIKRANAQLAADGQTPLPEGLTLHALRRTRSIEIQQYMTTCS
jgi:hypothetical protein